jgi:tight adherence protein B
MRWWGVALVGAVVFFGVVVGVPVLALVAGYLVWRAPRFLLNRRLGQRRVLLRDQLVPACVSLANATRAGLSLGQGLESIANETPPPLAAEVRRIVFEFHGGRPLAAALRDTQERLRLDSFTLFASAILVCLERGGRITEALERIARSLQEHQRLERKMEADTASGRKVVILLACFPAFFLGLFYMFDPEGTGLLFDNLAGQGVLLLVCLLVYVSVRWAWRILGSAGAGL